MVSQAINSEFSLTWATVFELFPILLIITSYVHSLGSGTLEKRQK